MLAVGLSYYKWYRVNHLAMCSEDAGPQEGWIVRSPKGNVSDKGVGLSYYKWYRVNHLAMCSEDAGPQEGWIVRSPISWRGKCF